MLLEGGLRAIDAISQAKPLACTKMMARTIGGIACLPRVSAVAKVSPSGNLGVQLLLENDTPSIEEYRDLRAATELSLKTVEQAERALPVVVKSKDSGTVVGMGRIVGDGGWYFHIVDMAVHPDHQRKGLGGAIMARLMCRILDEAPQGPYVSLVADEAGRPLYKKWGFVETAPRSVGMERRFDGPRPNY